jgi:hypothetical protein
MDIIFRQSKGIFDVVKMARELPRKNHLVEGSNTQNKSDMVSAESAATSSEEVKQNVFMEASMEVRVECRINVGYSLAVVLC